MSNDRGPKVRRPELPAEDSAYLRLLGERVRDMRARRGMTRKILARDSGVSERYLAQLEAGQGNFSVILLRQVAQAMGLPMEDLVRDGPDQPPELTLLSQYLGRLSPAKLAHARKLLQAEFETTGKRERRHRIALIGLRGGGKSTLGGMLALRLGVPFIELASEIERVAGVTLSEVFSLYGQIAYRRYERRALESVVEAHDGFVVAPGGSVVSEPATFDLLLTHCFTVWLRASPEEHMARVVAQGDSRPMRDNEEAMEDLKRILAGREAMYSKADVVVDTTGRTTEQSVEDILSLLPA
ncbi:MAG: helix-turn-helix transcriptional regulator [Rhodocyclaceae bacterium]|jgi:XRE family transcriptional regulator, aerobic/anaerobic benzoate catabolism transcriptional regulator